MRITPNSWGSEIKEFNPNHEPAGSPKGGQFAPKKSGGAGDTLNINGVRASRGMDGRWYPFTSKGNATHGPGFANADQFRQYVETTGGAPRQGYASTTLYRDVTGGEKIYTIGRNKYTWDTTRADYVPYPKPKEETAPKAEEPPVADEPEPQIVKEPPTAKPKKASGVDAGGVLGVANHADDGAVEALGLGDVEQLAQNMIAGITSEKFSIEINSEGSSSEPSGPDPDEVRDEYDRYMEDASSEAEQNAYNESKSDYVSNADRAVPKMAAMYESLKAEYAGRITFLDKTATVAQAESAFQNLTALSVDHLLGDEGSDGEDGIFNEEGYLQRGDVLETRMRAMFEAAIENGDTTLPREFHGGFDESELLPRSKYFNDDDGFSNWADDGQNSSAFDDLPTFETWYEREYNVDPSNWEGGGEVDPDSAQVTIDFTGDKGTTIRRTFSYKDGELHVHHDFFRVGDERGGGDGLGKELFRSSIAEYQRLGVGSVSVYADIDSNGTGKYSWARYGFEADNPRSIHRSMTGQIDRLQREGVITGKEAKALKGLINPNDNRNVWEMSDTRIYVGRERALSIIPKVQRGSDDAWNRMLEADANKGFINIGKIIMANRDASSWEGTLNLSDPDQMARLRGYLGD
jgi:hypothetical protein